MLKGSLNVVQRFALELLMIMEEDEERDRHTWELKLAFLARGNPIEEIWPEHVTVDVPMGDDLFDDDEEEGEMIYVLEDPMDPLEALSVLERIGPSIELQGSDLPKGEWL